MMSNDTSNNGNNDDDGTTSSTSTHEMIASIILREFYSQNSQNQNPPNPPNPPTTTAATTTTLLSTSKILLKLLKNAIDDTKKEECGTIRLANPKIRRHVVQVRGALDVLGAAGFAKDDVPGREGYLVFDRNSTRAAVMHESSSSEQQEQKQERRRRVDNEERHALIHAICDGLQMKIRELDRSSSSSSSSSSVKAEVASKSEADASKPPSSLASSTSSTPPTTTSPTSPTTAATSNSEFLSDPERTARIRRLKSQKRAERVQRELSKRRWAEDMEEKRKSALEARRRKAAAAAAMAAISASNSNEANGKASASAEGEEHDENDVGIDGRITGEDNDGLPPPPLARPFEDSVVGSSRSDGRVVVAAGLAKGTAATGSSDSDPQTVRRRLIRECVRDAKLTSRERQRRIRELMRMSDVAVLIATAAAAAGDDDDGGDDGDEDAGGGDGADAALSERDIDEGTTADANDDDDDDDDEKPSAAIETPPPSSRSDDDDFAKSRTVVLRRPSPEWIRFAKRIPRCAGAEGIRDSSVFYAKKSAAGASSSSSSSSNADGTATTLLHSKCLKRLFRELDELNDDLPCDSNCGIWLRFDEETPQYIRALIAAPLPGPTPYSGGLFAFDIYIPNNYPQTNPEVRLLTTGGGRVRFGPNLYADGKVCLSLLGTWSGPKWNPKHSSLYQILISIQGLVLGVEHPYYLEPGFGGWEGEVKEGDFRAVGRTLAGDSVEEELGVPLRVVLYEGALRVGTARYAMIQPLERSLASSIDDAERCATAIGSTTTTGLEAFDEIVRAHFCENKTAILSEVRNWMSDRTLGRNRNEALEQCGSGVRAQGVASMSGNDGKAGAALQIDALQGLLPKLEELLNKASIPQDCGNQVEGAPGVGSGGGADAVMDVEEDCKRPARTEDDSKPSAKPREGKTKQKLGTSAAQRNTPSTDADVVERKRRQMQEAAKNGNFILAGILQGEVQRLEELQRSMEEAAKRGDFIRAGRLQAQFKGLAEDAAGGNAKSAATKKSDVDQQPSNSGWNNNEMNDEWSEGEDSDGGGEETDWGDDDMDEDGPSFGPGHHPHGPGAFPPSGHASRVHHSWGIRSWGTGRTLAAPPAAAALPATKMPTTEESKKAAIPRRVVPRDQLCRLRIRLPRDKSVVEDFDKNDSLAEVYRRLEGSVPTGSGTANAFDTRRRSAAAAIVGGPSAPGGAFSQPHSLAGFTLLLTRPKREFSLEMHGTKSLAELNLAPSATLTVMKCNERGIVYRGEVESRLKSAQGDAMDVEGLTYEGLVELTERVGKAAPKAGEAFLTLTMEEYEDNTTKISPSAYLVDLDWAEKHEEEDRRCPICLGCYGGFDVTPSLRTLNNCGHTMHAGCLQTWLSTNSSCPLCKMAIVEDGKKKSSLP